MRGSSDFDHPGECLKQVHSTVPEIGMCDLSDGVWIKAWTDSAMWSRLKCIDQTGVEGKCPTALKTMKYTQMFTTATTQGCHLGWLFCLYCYYLRQKEQRILNIKWGDLAIGLKLVEVVCVLLGRFQTGWQNLQSNGSRSKPNWNRFDTGLKTRYEPFFRRSELRSAIAT